MTFPRKTAFCLLGVLLISGCGIFRGIPSHGGGKRFDEEQRVVAGAVRQTLADLDLTELSGKKVQLVVECIAQDGGGNVTFPGVTGISASAYSNWGTNNLVQVIPPPVPGQPNLINDNRNRGTGASSAFNYNPNINYGTHAFGTGADVTYFRAALEMKARHAGLVLVNAEADAVLYVLVDVLGTNRSQSNQILQTNDRLVASCETTYYAMDAKSGGLIFEARRTSANSSYSETRQFLVTAPVIERSIARTTPTSLPIDEAVKPTTQPTHITKRKDPVSSFINRIAGVSE
jgi:hypothetical protein